jgi:hypothetical protein
LISEKNVSILAKVTQVSDVAHGPLVETFFFYLMTLDFDDGATLRILPHTGAFVFHKHIL